jgi:class I fructose-bisphosphate aldolase
MLINQITKRILSFYGSDKPGVKKNLANLLSHGKLGGTGKMVIYPVDQGFEHGPGRSYSINPPAYDPYYHYKFAVKAGVSAYAAPLGWLEAGVSDFIGQVPLILKMNSSNTLFTGEPDQAITASVKDALHLGCTAIGFTIYPGSSKSLEMMEEARELIREAKEVGIPSIVWSYPRGDISKEGETALDVVAYGAHMAALLGAHVIKVKLPSDHLENKESKEQYIKHNIPRAHLAERVKHVVQSCFEGKRIVVFSGGEAKDIDSVYDDARAIKAGGGYGSIIARNCFKRPFDEALTMIQKIMAIYKER